MEVATAFEAWFGEGARRGRIEDGGNQEREDGMRGCVGAISVKRGVRALLRVCPTPPHLPPLNLEMITQANSGPQPESSPPSSKLDAPYTDSAPPYPPRWTTTFSAWTLFDSPQPSSVPDSPTLQPPQNDPRHRHTTRRQPHPPTPPPPPPGRLPAAPAPPAAPPPPVLPPPPPAPTAPW